VVHSFPTQEPLKDGDVISLDIGVCKTDFLATAHTHYALGEVSEEGKTIAQVTKDVVVQRG
jgi:methionyl aminopeptidase